MDILAYLEKIFLAEGVAQNLGLLIATGLMVGYMLRDERKKYVMRIVTFSIVTVLISGLHLSVTIQTPASQEAYNMAGLVAGIVATCFLSAMVAGAWLCVRAEKIDRKRLARLRDRIARGEPTTKPFALRQ